LCLEDAAGRVAYATTSEEFKRRAECRAQHETFALVPSFLQGHASIDTMLCVLLVV